MPVARSFSSNGMDAWLCNGAPRRRIIESSCSEQRSSPTRSQALLPHRVFVIGFAPSESGSPAPGLCCMAGCCSILPSVRFLGRRGVECMSSGLCFFFLSVWGLGFRVQGLRPASLRKPKDQAFWLLQVHPSLCLWPRDLLQVSSQGPWLGQCVH